jgi:glucosamine--fructose-6-phosphate aminotransferase (isomerizing)
MHFVDWAPPIDPRDAVILISHNAGTETAYAGATWTLAVGAGMLVVPITRRGGELPGALQTVDKEPSHTYTVSYTTVLALLARIADALGAPSLGTDVLAGIPEAVAEALADPTLDAVAPPGRLLVIAGEGPAAVTAREAALKVREAARFPAEGYDIEYLLHGHAVPLGGEDHLVLLAPPDTDGLVEAVGAAATAEGVPVTHLEVGAGLPPVLAQIPLIVPLQRLALRYSAERGFDPDLAIERAWADEALWAIGSPPGRSATAG